MNNQRVHTDDATDGTSGVSVALCRVHGGTHTGIVIRDAGGALKIYHMPMVRRPVRIESLSQEFIRAVPPEILPERGASVAALCRLIGKRYCDVGLPYSFKYTPDMIFHLTDGKFEKGTGYGLTCATFVLAVLQSIGIQLVVYDSWPKRTDDVE